jgi:hypothetical protein
MHLLRFFLALPSVARSACAEAHPCIRALIQPQPPLSQPSARTFAALWSSPHTANPTFSHPSQSPRYPKLPFKSHSAPRPPQAPAASS